MSDERPSDRACQRATAADEGPGRGSDPPRTFSDKLSPEQLEQFYRTWRYGRDLPDEWEQLNPFLEDGGSRIVPVLHLIDEAIPIGDYECDLTDPARSGLRTMLHTLIAAMEVLEARETAFREVWAEMMGQRGVLLLLDQEESDD